MPGRYINATINRIYAGHNGRKEQKEAKPVRYNKNNISCIVSPNVHRAYLSASATVEAALVMPLFIYAVTAVMYIMQMLSVQLHIQKSLYNECRLLARYAYLSDCLQTEMTVMARYHQIKMWQMHFRKIHTGKRY